jgi:hypothetical protein
VVAVAAFSRVYLGAHHASDVAAAVLLGVAWLGMCLSGEPVAQAYGPVRGALSGDQGLCGTGGFNRRLIIRHAPFTDD